MSSSENTSMQPEDSSSSESQQAVVAGNAVVNRHTVTFDFATSYVSTSVVGGDGEEEEEEGGSGNSTWGEAPPPRRNIISFRNASFVAAANDKPGPLPATKEAIDGMPRIRVTEEEEGGECAICLGGIGVGCEIREMPCKHRKFHSGCIEKWLGRNRSCPLCRFMMPLDHFLKKKKKKTN
ncbi:hypothetical protein Tsubulata_010139 [Turnera subulata]|uniref:RING-type E3 ubiquitin transferase n=1 Tax=Turnera subulata TaxID=218843 RepID=A0A9Q0J9E8_9ROSI|nr:hypothetical protein Tsubulata_010139 [Turnera subulata]